MKHTLFELLDDLTEEEEKEILLRSRWLGATDHQREMTDKIVDHLKATPYDLSVLLPIYAIILKSSKKDF